MASCNDFTRASSSNTSISSRHSSKSKALRLEVGIITSFTVGLILMLCMSSVLKKFSTEFALEAEFVIVFIDGMDFFSMINGLAANRALGSCILHLFEKA